MLNTGHRLDSTMCDRVVTLSRQRGLIDSKPTKDATRPRSTRTNPGALQLGELAWPGADLQFGQLDLGAVDHTRRVQQLVRIDPDDH